MGWLLWMKVEYLGSALSPSVGVKNRAELTSPLVAKIDTATVRGLNDRQMQSVGSEGPCLSSLSWVYTENPGKCHHQWQRPTHCTCFCASPIPTSAAHAVLQISVSSLLWFAAWKHYPKNKAVKVSQLCRWNFRRPFRTFILWVNIFSLESNLRCHLFRTHELVSWLDDVRKSPSVSLGNHSYSLPTCLWCPLGAYMCVWDNH